MYHKIRIGILIENFLRDSGGAENYGLRLAACLKDKYEVKIYCKQGDRLPAQVFRQYNVSPIEIYEYRFASSKLKIVRAIERRNRQKILNHIIPVECDVFINCTSNRFVGYKDKIKSIHIIHFPENSYLDYWFIPKIISRKLDARYANSYDIFLANSYFTQYWIKQKWGLEADILNPPISMTPIAISAIKNKKNIIIMVGRLIANKKIIEAVTIFNEKIAKYYTEWQLIIIGNKDSDSEEYYSQLKNIEMESNQIVILEDAPFEILLDYYKKASIFWHAAGYNVPASKPHMMEHFGMTTVEAMSQGCVPVVIDKAGQKEIVVHNENGFRWNTLEELASYTKELIQNSEKRFDMSLAAINGAKKFLAPEFEVKAKKIISNLLEEQYGKG